MQIKFGGETLKCKTVGWVESTGTFSDVAVGGTLCCSERSRWKTGVRRTGWQVGGLHAGTTTRLRGTLHVAGLLSETEHYIYTHSGSDWLLISHRVV